MEFPCSVNGQERTVSIALPTTPTKIAVFMSGGLDSAILYYLMLKADIEQGRLHEIATFTINRTEGSRYFARPVIAHVHSQFNMPYKEPIVVGDPSLPGHLQVMSGAASVQHMGYQLLYGGVIDQLPEHIIGYEPAPVEENEVVKLPFKDLTKGYIVDLILRHKQEALFYLTHSCSILEIGKCNTCNGCNERNWGFAQCGLRDPGTI
jgi:7-cyano-7-deazaguanine synthase in queuosine biosynthesis